MTLELTTKPATPIKDKFSPEEALSLLELSEIIKSLDSTQEDEKNQEGMRDNNGRWIKY